MTKTLKVISWNIAGGHTIKSLDMFDYEKENLSYFADMIRKYAPDVICLQETHSNESRSIASELAKLLHYEFVYENAASPSHIDESFMLGQAIISRIPLKNMRTIVYPYPTFPLLFSDGREAAHHDKILQIAQWGKVMIANTQMMPLKIFSEEYDTENGAGFSKEIDEVLTSSLDTPLIFCGDFNFNQPVNAFPKMYKKFSIANALPDSVTRPDTTEKLAPDHILYSPELSIINAKVVETQTDHFLCFAEFKIPE